MKKRKKFCCILAGLICTAIISPFGSAVTEGASLPYMTYNYDDRDYVVHTPAAYVPEKAMSGTDYIYQGEQLGNFQNPQDICKSADGKLYIADTLNNRIVILKEDLQTVSDVLTEFENAGKIDTFRSPTGVCVSKNGDIYIADSLNRRIVILAADKSLRQIVANPTSESLDDGYVFTPLKITVDYAGRIYCIAQNMFEGIMVFESDGSFTGFFGTISVKISLMEKFWKRIATKEERQKQKLYIPTEFTGVDVDDDGFIYASSIDEAGQQAVRRLNPKGQDVIKTGPKEKVGGDLWIEGDTKYAGASQITDVVYRGKGIYSLLDRKRGRIFTYDHEGNLLYIFGGLGTQTGTFTTPAAIEVIGNRLIVLDSAKAELVVFDVTKYGSYINEAVSLRYDGDESQAVAMWAEVLKLDANNELANTGMGKAYLTAGENKLAMKYLKIGMSKDYYSIAFRRYRNEILKENLDLILTIILLLVVGSVIYRRVRRKKKGSRKEEQLL